MTAYKHETVHHPFASLRFDSVQDDIAFYVSLSLQSHETVLHVIECRLQAYQTDITTCMMASM